jgi:MFS transporter, ENTS family, enterobactin (siderophore) exporter
MPAPRAPGLRHNREFVIVLAGQTVSAFGDAIAMTALPLLVVALTGSGTLMGIVGVLQRLPDLVLGLPVGALADRWDRRSMIIWADLGRAALTALIPLAALAGWDVITVVLLVSFPINALRVVFLAAWTAVMPSIVRPSEVGRAGGYAEAVFNLSYIVGPAIAGALIGVVGPGTTLTIDALSFVGSALSLLLIGRPLRADRGDQQTRIVEDIREGLRYLVREPVLRVAISFWTVVSVITAPLPAIAIFLLTVDRHESADLVGLVLSAYGLGGLVGALVAARLAHGRLGRQMLVANVAMALALLGFAVAREPLIQAATVFLVGALGALVFVPYLTLRATIPPGRLLGRVGSTARTISVGLTPIGTLVGGLLLDAVGGEAALAVAMAAMLVTSVGFAASRPLRRAVAGTASPA